MSKSFLGFIVVACIFLYFSNLNKLETLDLEAVNKQLDLKFMNADWADYSGATVLWTLQSKKDFDVSTPFHVGNETYVLSDGVPYKIDKETGEPSFNFKKRQINDAQTSNISHHLVRPVENKDIVIEQQNSTLKIMDAKQNVELWAFTAHMEDIEYIATETILFVKTHHGTKTFNSVTIYENLYTFDIRTGKQILHYKNEPNHSIDFKAVWNLDNHLLFRLRSELVLIDKQTGELQWAYEYRDTISSKQVEDGYLYIVSTDKQLSVINLSTGTLQWASRNLDIYAYDFLESNNVNGEFPATFVGNKMFISALNGIKVVDKVTGQLIWQLQIENKKGSDRINFAEPVRIEDDILYAASTSGHLFAIKLAE